jgi:hypothetical protein
MTDEIRDRLWNEFVERGEPFATQFAAVRRRPIRPGLKPPHPAATADF